MTGWWNRGRKRFDLEAELRARRVEPRSEFTQIIAERIRRETARPGLYRLSRLSFAAAVSVFMLGTFASFGGLGYAASSTKSTLDAVKRVAAETGVSTETRSPAQTQYETEEEELGSVGEATARPSRAEAGARPAVAGARTQEELPFTGLGLATTALLGGALTGLGFALRRSSRRDREE